MAHKGIQATPKEPDDPALHIMHSTECQRMLCRSAWKNSGRLAHSVISLIEQWLSEKVKYERNNAEDVGESHLLLCASLHHASRVQG